MKYSYNLDKTGIIFASTSNINASFKDLCAVCDAIRYMGVNEAMGRLDDVINRGLPIEYRRHNKYMGSRHELHGKKGRYPKKCAALVRKVLVNAYANAKGKGEDPESMCVVHASANKTFEMARTPPKGARSVGGNYGYSQSRASNIEYAKIEIGISHPDLSGLGARMKRAIKAMSRKARIEEKRRGKKAQAPNAKPSKGSKGPASAKQQASEKKPEKMEKAAAGTAEAGTEKSDAKQQHGERAGNTQQNEKVGPLPAPETEKKEEEKV